MDRAQRPALSPSSGGPGPADYQGQGSSASPKRPSSGAFGRDPRFHASPTAGGPGPGDFDISPSLAVVRPSSAKVVIGTAQRTMGSPESVNANAPLLAPNLAVVLPASPRQPIGSAPRFSPSKSDLTPGPGAFSPSSKSSGPAFTIRMER
jgi:hypothetical protein